MQRLVVAHTAQLEPATLHETRALLDEAFDGEFGHQDWENSLGGMHALVYADDRLVAHGALVQRRLLHGGQTLRTGYVEGVGVRQDARRHGHGSTVMSALEALCRRAYDFGALSSTDAALSFYVHRGWLRWTGTTSALTPQGMVRTPDDDDAVFVLPLAAELDQDGDLTCDWREGDLW